MEEMLNGESNNVSLFKNITKYAFKTLGFIIFLALLPIINLVIIWFTFKMFVLNGNVDFKPMIKFVGDKLKMNKSEDEEEYLSDEDFDSLTEDNVVVLGVQDIKSK